MKSRANPRAATAPKLQGAESPTEVEGVIGEPSVAAGEESPRREQEVRRTRHRRRREEARRPRESGQSYLFRGRV